MLRILVPIFVFIYSALSQVDTFEVKGASLIGENLLIDMEPDHPVDELIDLMENMRIDINNASIDELLSFPFLSVDVARKIISYRKKIGKFKNREQILKIPGIDPSIKSLLARYSHLPHAYYIRVRSRIIFRNFKNINEIRSNFNRYSKMYQRIIAGYANFSGGILLERDYGETKLSDLVRFFIEYRSDGIIRRVIIGDYIPQVGQGIIYWRPVAFSKGSEVIYPVRKYSESLISPYISTDEVKPLRGLSIISGHENFKLALFYSRTVLPVRLDEMGNVRSVDFSGYGKGTETLGREVFGGAVALRISDLLIGLSSSLNKFSRKFSTEFKMPFEGGKFLTSLNYSWRYRDLQVFGELAFNDNFYISSINGFIINKRSLKLAFLYRELSSGFASINGNAFGERFSEAWNESGFYSGLRLKFWRFEIYSYFDIFKFPVNRFTHSGTDYLLGVKFKKSRFSLYVRFREKRVFGIVSSYDEFRRRILLESSKLRRNIRFEFINSFSGVSFRSRVEVSRYVEISKLGRGFLIFQGVRIGIFDNLRAYVRVIFVDVDDYSARIYEYENDIDGVISLVPLYGRGIRWYVVLKYILGGVLSVQLKYARWGGESGFGNLFAFQVELEV
jgi:hypothetical protein